MANPALACPDCGPEAEIAILTVSEHRYSPAKGSCYQEDERFEPTLRTADDPDGPVSCAACGKPIPVADPAAVWAVVEGNPR